MKHSILLTGLLFLMFDTLNCSENMGQFNFSLEKNSDKAIISEDDFLSQDEMAYDMVCDRTVLEKPSFWKRALTQVYIFWYCHSRGITDFVTKNYTKLKNYTYAWYVYLSPYNNHIKK